MMEIDKPKICFYLWPHYISVVSDYVMVQSFNVQLMTDTGQTDLIYQST